jgi:hypothetical protein
MSIFTKNRDEVLAADLLSIGALKPRTDIRFLLCTSRYPFVIASLATLGPKRSF